MRPYLAALAFVALAACATSGTGSSRSGVSDRTISAEEIAAFDGPTAWHLVQNYRPRWLRGRGGDPPVVYVDGVQSGGPEALRNVSTTSIRGIRWISGADATIRYGTGHGGGVIEVSTGRR